jgi:hypothetical protein
VGAGSFIGPAAMNTRDSARADVGGEDTACTRAWDRLEHAEARLQRAGGPSMVAAIDAFYDAWTERLASLVAGDHPDETLRAVEATLRLMEAAATTPEARRAMAAFVSIAVLEVETAVLRSVGNDLMGPGFAASVDVDFAPPRGSC